MNPKLILIILSFALNYALGQSSEFTPKYITILTEETGISLMNQCSRKSYKEVKKFWILDDANFDNLIKNFNKISSLKSNHGPPINDLQTYGYQLFGIEINKKKYIYVNAFGISKEGPDLSRKGFHKNWETKAIKVCGGGNYFWGVLFDIESTDFLELSVNGEDF